VDAAHSAGISVVMCGEMAGEPLYLPILLGLGIDELSMNPLCILKIKKILRSISYHDAQQLAAQVDQFKTATEIENFMSQELDKRLQEELQ
jgi:phosphotransferase system enzyme I (PtsI)